MRATSIFLGASMAFLLSVAGATAAPCTTGTITDHTGQASASSGSSNVDGNSTTKVSPGGKSESPGTVGAMKKVGANAMPAAGEATPAEGKVVKPGDTDC